VTTFNTLVCNKSVNLRT